MSLSVDRTRDDACRGTVGALDVEREGLWWQGPHSEIHATLTNTLLVMGRKTPLRVDAPALARRMQSPALRDDLARVETPTPGALLSLYVAGTDRLRGWAEGVPSVGNSSCVFSTKSDHDQTVEPRAK